MQGRGLKPVYCFAKIIYNFVAPHAGAWIETSKKTTFFIADSVAPHAGAWIKTACMYTAVNIKY